MISRADLRKLARARLKDAEALCRSGRYDGAVYLCGYAVEFGLKAPVCRTLKWAAFPATRKEFESYQSFRTHNLDVLLRLSGVEARIRTQHVQEWANVVGWDPDVRYRVVGHVQAADARRMIESAGIIVGAL